MCELEVLQSYWDLEIHYDISSNSNNLVSLLEIIYVILIKLLFILFIEQKNQVQSYPRITWRVK